NYRDYRNKIEIIEPPCIPLQDVILRDITFIEESPTVFENGWINVSKILLLGKTLKAIKKFQNVQYGFKLNSHIQQFLDVQIVLTEEELFEQSRRIETESDKRNNEHRKERVSSITKKK